MKTLHLATIHPEMMSHALGFGAAKQAQSRKKIQFKIHNLRDFATDDHGSVDARPYGGGEGMVMRPEPLARLVQSIPNLDQVILTGPEGQPWTHDSALAFSQEGPQVSLFICGRFGGLDQRFIDHYVDVTYCLGPFIVSGGELPVLMMVDSICRLMPGGMGNPESAVKDSFSDAFASGLEPPQYTRPPVFEGIKVPDPLTSGDHAAIEKWKAKAAVKRTKDLRPDLTSP